MWSIFQLGFYGAHSEPRISSLIYQVHGLECCLVCECSHLCLSMSGGKLIGITRSKNHQNVSTSGSRSHQRNLTKAPYKPERNEVFAIFYFLLRISRKEWIWGRLLFLSRDGHGPADRILGRLDKPCICRVLLSGRKFSTYCNNSGHSWMSHSPMFIGSPIDNTWYDGNNQEHTTRR